MTLYRPSGDSSTQPDAFSSAYSRYSIVRSPRSKARIDGRSSSSSRSGSFSGEASSTAPTYSSMLASSSNVYTSPLGSVTRTLFTEAAESVPEVNV